MNIQLTAQPNLAELQNYLSKKKWLAEGEKITSTERPGEGNMNLVLRAKTGRRSLILKQSKPFVQKYPQIVAPVGRILVEQKFYKTVADRMWLSDLMPKILGFDAKNHLLALEDLGEGSDFSFIYKKEYTIAAADLQTAVSWLGELHGTYFPEAEKKAFSKNLALRRLNFQHLFHFPFLVENGFDLDTVQPGLAKLAVPFKTDLGLKKRLENLGKIYLSNGETLLHGDFYPGSWLRTAAGFKVIDPEFAFFGPAEYDFGVMLAHLMLAKTPENLMEIARKNYPPKPGFDHALAANFTGMEILRRLIGLAQLPLELDLGERENLLARAVRLV